MGRNNNGNNFGTLSDEVLRKILQSENNAKIKRTAKPVYVFVLGCGKFKVGKIDIEVKN